MAKFFKYPFAVSGDKTALPETTQPSGLLSYEQGFGPDYAAARTDPNYKAIPRDYTNELFYDVTSGLQQYQTHGVPDFITTSDNGGTAYSYAKGAVVLYGGNVFTSLVASNTATPADETKWRRAGSLAYRSVSTSPYTVSAIDRDYVLNPNAVGGAATINLPTVVGEAGMSILIQRDAYDVTINTTGLANIRLPGGSVVTSLTLSTGNGYIYMYQNGSGNWLVVSCSPDVLNLAYLNGPTFTGTVTADTIKTSGSSGLTVQNSAAATVANFGSAGTTNSSLSGALTIGGVTTISGGTLTVGSGATGAVGIEVGASKATAGNAQVDLTTETGAVDYNARLLRNSGANGNLDLINTGTGTLRFYNNTSNLAAQINGSTGNLGLQAAAGSNGLYIYKTTAGDTVRSENTTSGTGADYYGYRNNASFTSEMIQLWCNTSAASSWSFGNWRSTAGADTEFLFRGDGNGFCDGSWTGGGADYAEYFEWADGNPNAEDRTGRSVCLADSGKIRLATDQDAPGSIIGVVSATPFVVGDSAWNKWSEKYLRDDFGRVIFEDHNVLEWEEAVIEEPAKDAVFETRTESRQKMETVQEEVEEVVFIDGLWRKVKAVKDIQHPVFSTVPLFDADGNAVMEQISEGVFRQAVAVVPVMETVEISVQFEEAKPVVVRVVNHSYASDNLPEGIVPPDNAVQKILPRRKLNPQYDPDVAYTPRDQRPEWAVVGLLGKLRIVKGQPVGDRWIKMFDVTSGVEQWLVR